MEEGCALSRKWVLRISAGLLLALIISLQIATLAIVDKHSYHHHRGNDTTAPAQSQVRVTRNLFGRTRAGKDVYSFTMSNSRGMSAEVITLGGILRVLKVPDKHDHPVDISLGYDNLAGYESRDIYPYFGAIIGRFAGRIKDGRFSIDGNQYRLNINSQGRDNLHGGFIGWDKASPHDKIVQECASTEKWFSKFVFLLLYHVVDNSVRIFEAIWVAEETNDGVLLSHMSPDGDEMYPGEVRINVTYQLTDDNELHIRMSATTTKPTPVNPTSHAYFNLAGQGSRDLSDHIITIPADYYLPVDDKLVPRGDKLPVNGTFFDMRHETRLDQLLSDITNTSVGGLDHTFCLRGPNGKRLAAVVRHVTSGVTVQCYTNQPGLQFYTANTLNATGKAGRYHGKHSAFTVETQNYPDAPNHVVYKCCKKITTVL